MYSKYSKTSPMLISLLLTAPTIGAREMYRINEGEQDEGVRGDVEGVQPGQQMVHESSPRKFTSRGKFTAEEDEAILELRAEGISWVEIGRALLRCGSAVRKRCGLLEKKATVSHPDPSPSHPSPSPDPKQHSAVPALKFCIAHGPSCKQMREDAQFCPTCGAEQ